LLLNDPDDAAGRLDALARGIDDALPRTVGAPEIGGRIRILADRTRGDAGDRLTVGEGVELDLAARALRRHGRLVHLRPMEFRLLEELARNPGRPVSRAWLLRRVWGSDGLDGSRTVDVHIRWLRAKVERDPGHPQHLLTVRGVGHQLELGTEAQEPDGTGR
jgi:two-component system KDP operon response regulator KdpE